MVWDVQISYWKGSNSSACNAVNFLGVLGGSVSLRYQLICCYNVSNMWVSFRYQLWGLCHMLSWSVSLRYQLVRRYNVSNKSVSLTYQLRRLDDISPWSTTSPPTQDLNETSLRRRIPGAERLIQRWQVCTQFSRYLLAMMCNVIARNFFSSKKF